MQVKVSNHESSNSDISDCDFIDKMENENFRTEESEKEEQDWLNDRCARHNSFVRKMDSATHRESFEAKGIKW